MIIFLKTFIVAVAVSLIAIMGYHTFYVKANYIKRDDIYVVNTNDLLRELGNMYTEKKIDENEFRSRASIMQKRLSEHPGLVFELGAMPGKIDNDIQSEFQDLLRK